MGFPVWGWNALRLRPVTAIDRLRRHPVEASRPLVASHGTRCRCFGPAIASAFDRGLSRRSCGPSPVRKFPRPRKRIAKNWSTWIGSSPVRTLLPVPICDRSRLVHSGAKADMAGGPNWPGVCIRSLSRIRALAPLAGALRRLRIVGGVGIVFGYSRDEPASGERLQVRLQCVSNLLGIDLPVVHVERKGF